MRNETNILERTTPFANEEESTATFKVSIFFVLVEEYIEKSGDISNKTSPMASNSSKKGTGEGKKKRVPLLDDESDDFTPECMQALEEIFARFDKDGDGRNLMISC